MGRSIVPLCLGALFLAALALSGCSTRPKTPTESYAIRNQVADYLKLADGFFSRGNYDSAVSFYNEAIKAASSVDHLEGVATARASLGRVYLAAGRSDDAERELLKAYEYAHTAGFRGAASLAASGLGEVLYRRGDREGALARFDEAIALADQDEEALAIALHNAATAKTALDRREEAKSDLERAAAINQKRKSWSEFAANRYLLASIYVKEGNLEAARNTAGEALDSDKKAENGRGIALDLAALGSLSRRLGKTEDAYWYWRRSFDTALAVDEAEGVRKALMALQELSAELGRPAEEISSWSEMLRRLDAGTTTPAGTGGN